jgi:hypothetical protein
MNSAVIPDVNMTAWATRARRAAKSAIPSQRWSAASGTGEPADQAADNRPIAQPHRDESAGRLASDRVASLAALRGPDARC